MLKAKAVEDQIKRLAALTGVMLLAAAEALAQEKLARPARRIVVSIPDRKLAVMEADRVVKVFSTAVGAPNSPSPTGSFQIVDRIPDPAWYGHGKIVPPGKNNPIGTRWLGLSLKGYGIHGTNEPNSIGHNVSHGCIRLRNRDIEDLFEMVSTGDQVELYGERTAELDRIFAPALVVVAQVQPPAAPVQSAAASDQR
jgi:lipoprotein-anchoring transpeptidase ErfK/SrfK